MTGGVLRLAARMEGERRPFALATVVRSERPTSGKPGDTALIASDGTMHGWIGGGCTRPEVIRHALEALRLGEPRLLAFGAAEGRPGDLVQVPMTCASGGKAEVHVNPILPSPVLLVAGDSPVALALLRLGGAMGYRTVATTPENEEAAGLADECAEGPARAARRYGDRAAGTRFFAVVATMGRDDERALAALAAAEPDYLGMVASLRRMRSARAALAGLGMGAEAIARIRGPAGLDLGARTPGEIAVSILAEIVGRIRRPGGETPDEGGASAEAGDAGAVPRGRRDHPGAAEEHRAGRRDHPGAGVGNPDVRRSMAAGFEGADAQGGGADSADASPAGRHGGATDARAGAWSTDPVCGMTVPVAGSPSLVHDDGTVHFCCEGCRGLFEANPEVFASRPAAGPA